MNLRTHICRDFAVVAFSATVTQTETAMRLRTMPVIMFARETSYV